MFGNGLSSSPSNSTKGQSGSKFPTITLWDNIYCQHKLVTEKLNIKFGFGFATLTSMPVSG